MVRGIGDVRIGWGVNPSSRPDARLRRTACLLPGCSAPPAQHGICVTAWRRLPEPCAAPLFLPPLFPACRYDLQNARDSYRFAVGPDGMHAELAERYIEVQRPAPPPHSP